MTTICLNMIVKNESHVILETLENICKYIKLDYWIISDTGSTDNTKQIIADFFNDKEIKGEFHDCEWKDFAYNRTYALQKAYGKSDYILFFDADDKIVGELNLPGKLIHDSYNFIFGNNNYYIRPLLVKNDIKWYYEGVLHEFLTCDKQDVKTDTIFGNYHVISGRTGNRNKNPNKYQDDAIVLEKAYYDAVKTVNELQYRYAFYCAQSYKDCDNVNKAIEWYKKRIETVKKGWNQETYYSALMIGNLYKQLNDYVNAIYYWNLTIDIDCERYEGIMNIIQFYRERQNYTLAYKYYQMLQPNPSINNKLFVCKNDYYFRKDYEFSIIAYYVGKYDDAILSFINLFNDKHSKSIKQLIINNFYFYVSKISIKHDNLKSQYLQFIDDMDYTDTIERTLQLL